MSSLTTRAPVSADSGSDSLHVGPVADVCGLHVSFARNGKRIHAVRGIDLQIGSGEIVGLVGESGSGKSVLSLALLGLLPEGSQPEASGSAFVGGVDMVSATTDVRRRVRRDLLGAVFQDPMTSLNPTMKIGRQVEEAAGSTQEALRLLKAVGIPQPERRLASFPHELSGGLRQRVMIAMAVAGDPALVIADEPTTALDVTVQAQVLQLLRRLRDEVGCSVLLITHDLGVAAQVADRVAVMYSGRIAEIGQTNDVLRAPAHPYTVGLMRSRLSLTTDRTRPIVTLTGSAPDPALPPTGCAYASRCPLVMDECATVLPEPMPVSRAMGASIGGTPSDDTIDALHRAACIADRRRVEELAAEPQLLADDLSDSRVVVPSGPDVVAPPPDAIAARVRQVERTFTVKVGRGRRKPLQALRGVSLSVAPGEAVAVVGESGSGKSTLLRVVAGLERHDAGSVEQGSAGGRPQMVFQDAGASLTPWLTVGELLDERLRSEGLGRKQRAERVMAALAQVGLPDAVAKARAGELSGGQRQRVALARATIVPPRVLLCDEPTSALDVSLAATVLNLVQRLRRDLGMAVIFVTHDLSVARIIGDRIAVVYCGRIVELGSAEDVVMFPKHPYTKALLAAVPDMGVEAPQVRGEPASPLEPPTGCAYHPRCPLALPQCGAAELDVRLTRLAEIPGVLLPPDRDERRVACIRPEEL